MGCDPVLKPSQQSLGSPEGLCGLSADTAIWGGSRQDRVRGVKLPRRGWEGREDRGSPGHGKWKFLAAH